MKSTLAIPALQATAKSHWYPPVRDAAKRAIEHIEAGKNYENKSQKTPEVPDYFSSSYFEVQTCHNIALAKIEEPKDKKLYKPDAKELLESLTYPAVIYSYGADNEEEQKAANPGGVIVVHGGNMVRHEHKRNQVPDVALRVDGGWLAGSRRGEWGGDLVYITDDRKPTMITNDIDDIEDIYKFGGRYITTTGVEHIDFDKGMIYELFQLADGSWQTKQWVMLPSAPRSSWFVESGELLVNTSRSGSILLSEDGSMRLAECTK